MADIVHRVAAMLLEDPTFANDLESWCEERCCVFDPSQDEDEHSHSYKELHKEFCLLIELRIEDFLRKEGYSVIEFWQRLMKAIDDDPHKALKGENIVLQALKAATDYSSFATTMRAIQLDRGLRK